MQLAEQLSSGDRELARLFQTVVSQTLGTIDQSFEGVKALWGLRSAFAI